MQQQQTDLEGRKPAAWPVAQAYATGKKGSSIPMLIHKQYLLDLASLFYEINIRPNVQYSLGKTSTP